MSGYHRRLMVGGLVAVMASVVVIAALSLAGVRFHGAANHTQAAVLAGLVLLTGTVLATPRNSPDRVVAGTSTGPARWAVPDWLLPAAAVGLLTLAWLGPHLPPEALETWPVLLARAEPAPAAARDVLFHFCSPDADIEVAPDSELFEAGLTTADPALNRFRRLDASSAPLLTRFDVGEVRWPIVVPATPEPSDRDPFRLTPAPDDEYPHEQPPDSLDKLSPAGLKPAADDGDTRLFQWGAFPTTHGAAPLSAAPASESFPVLFTSIDAPPGAPHISSSILPQKAALEVTFAGSVPEWTLAPSGFPDLYGDNKLHQGPSLLRDHLEARSSLRAAAAIGFLVPSRLPVSRDSSVQTLAWDRRPPPLAAQASPGSFLISVPIIVVIALLMVATGWRLHL